MTTCPDLGPAASRLASLIAGVRDDQLTSPTPCINWTLGDLIDHVGGFALGFTNAARKGGPPLSEAAPAGDVAGLEPGWRERVAADLLALAEAWKQPDAWTGATRVGGVDLPGEQAGMFALDELVVHGWDVARASRQPHEGDEASLEPVHQLLLGFAAPEMAEQRSNIFAPTVAVAADGRLLDRVIGLSGRHPGW